MYHTEIKLVQWRELQVDGYQMATECSIIAEDGHVAAVVTHLQERVAKLHGERRCASYEAYYARTGKRWELLVEESKATKRRRQSGT